MTYLKQKMLTLEWKFVYILGLKNKNSGEQPKTAEILPNIEHI